MKKIKKIINIAIHKMTGAKIPVVVQKVNEKGIIEKYGEYTDKRKGFTLQMLCNRWDKAIEDVMEILQKYQVPGYIKHPDVMAVDDETRNLKKPADFAIFFEEYIYAIEKKTKMSHKKLKPKELNSFTEH